MFFQLKIRQNPENSFWSIFLRFPAISRWFFSSGICQNLLKFVDNLFMMNFYAFFPRFRDDFFVKNLLKSPQIRVEFIYHSTNDSIQSSDSSSLYSVSSGPDKLPPVSQSSGVKHILPMPPPSHSPAQTSSTTLLITTPVTVQSIPTSTQQQVKLSVLKTPEFLF